MAPSRDLFDDTSMTFGEHLECLRTHLVKALIGLVLCVIVTLIYGDRILAIVRSPIDHALMKYGQKAAVTDDLPEGPPMFSWEWLKAEFGFEPDPVTGGTGTAPAAPGDPASNDATPDTALKMPNASRDSRTIEVQVLPSELAGALHAHDPQHYPPTASRADEKPLVLRLAAREFAVLESMFIRQNQAVTLNVQEAFMTYMKVSFIAGLLLASPWVFYQLWLFVAAGLFPHERKYVYIYLPLSTFLFTGGAVFAFVAVFPFVLKFLLSFNELLGVQPQIRLSEWISFAVVMPLMFGISFQLPLVMLFLERISLFSVTVYREKRRMAILVIAFLSMVLTPADPMSMLLMMFPLLFLYELGIVMCAMRPSRPEVPPGLTPV